MRLSLIFIRVLSLIITIPVVSQDNFSVSIDVGESSNHSHGIFNNGDGLLLFTSLHFCPPVGATSCVGYISCQMYEGFLSDTKWSIYPDQHKSSGKRSFCRFGNKFLHLGIIQWEGEPTSGFRLMELDGQGYSDVFLDVMDPSVCDSDCYFRSILTDSNNQAIYIMGQMATEEDIHHPFLMKLDSTGEKKWTSMMDRHWGRGNVLDAQWSPDGSILIVSRNGSATHMVARVTKVSPDGEVLFDRHYDTGRMDFGWFHFFYVHP
jgi:hypothetical protein